jgi:hypothetical protein
MPGKQTIPDLPASTSPFDGIRYINRVEFPEGPGRKSVSEKRNGNKYMKVR